MDTSKKHLYFNPTTDSVAAAVSVPVSGFLGMEATEAGSLTMYFREGHDSDTLDIKLTRSTSGDDPKLVMEEIVNAINFSKESTVVVADNFTGEYLTPKIQEIALLNDGFVAPILFQRPTTFLVSEGADGIPEAAGNGFNTASYTFETGSVGQINGEVITTLFIDLALNAASHPANSDVNQRRVIGKAGSTAPAYLTQITEAKNGVVYSAELICVETPTASSGAVVTDLDIIGATEDDAKTGDNLSGSGLIIGAADIAKGDIVKSPTGAAESFNGLTDRYLYLTTGKVNLDGAYGAGKFILRLFGAPTVNLNDISL